MAFKLSKSDLQRRDGYVSQLRELHDKLTDAIREYNAKLADLKAPVEAALAAYNEVVEEARGFVEDLASEHRGAFDDKSESWQNGDKGQAVSEWIDALENADIAEAEVEFPEDANEDLDTTAPDALEEITAEPEDA